MPEAPARRTAFGKLARRRGTAAILFLAPMAIVLAAVAAWPLARTIWFGLTDASLDDLAAAKFVGLRNYFHVLTLESGRHYFSGLLVDPAWWRAVWNTVKFAAISVFFETVFGDYRELFRLEDEWNPVTAADVQRVAARYLVPNGRTTAVGSPCSL